MAEYTDRQREQRRKATERYQKTVDRINCRFPKGTKERIEKTGNSCNAFITNRVLEKLDAILKGETRNELCKI